MATTPAAPTSPPSVRTAQRGTRGWRITCLAFYSDNGHRKRRWKAAIKAQCSEEKLYKRIEELQKDERPIILAYGSWGMVAGRAGAACNKGNAPCIGVGLMRKLSKRYHVSPTPVAYTSKTCCRCFSACEPWQEVEEASGKKMRGLRRCTQRYCMLPLNRDKNGADQRRHQLSTPEAKVRYGP